MYIKRLTKSVWFYLIYQGKSFLIFEIVMILKGGFPLSEMVGEFATNSLKRNISSNAPANQNALKIF